MKIRRSALQQLTLAFAFACLPLTGSFAQDKKPAIDGYDPVAYFTEKRPVQGNATMNYDFDDKRYLFSSAKNRDLFAVSPERYEPQFGGLCAAALSNGRTVKADPRIWRIVDGKLYVYAKEQASEEAYVKAAVVASAKWKDEKK